MKKRIITLFMALVIALSVFSGCNKEKPVDHGDPNANATVPADSLTLEIGRDSSGKQVEYIGAELDPHFITGNVGRVLTKEDGTQVTVTIDDWTNIIFPRMKEMNLSYVRTMLLPSWWAKEEVCYTEKAYTWDSAEMQDVYLVLEAAQELGMEVCLVPWLWDCDYARMTEFDEASDPRGWTICPKGEGETIFATVVADCIDYLINEKGYTCIKYFTPINEPNSTFAFHYSNQDVYMAYDSLCRECDRVFREKGIRDDVKFSLSDASTGEAEVWLTQSCDSLLADGVADIVNTHWYAYDENCTNEKLQSNWRQMFGIYEDIADEYNATHVYGEFGVTKMDYDDVDRGVHIARVAANMFHRGAQGMSYWMLFCYYWNWDTRENNDLGNIMGLWDTAANDYNCKPTFYAYSLLTRFVQKGMEIYPVPTVDPNLVAVAFRAENQWTYLVINDSATDSKKVSFLNNTKFPETMNRYVYSANNVPTNNKVIASNGSVTADGRVITDVLGPMSCTVYTTLSE